MIQVMLAARPVTNILTVAPVNIQMPFLEYAYPTNLGSHTPKFSRPRLFTGARPRVSTELMMLQTLQATALIMSCNIAQSCKNACHFLEIFGQNVKMLGI
jgi:hypothetical protein